MMTLVREAPHDHLPNRTYRQHIYPHYRAICADDRVQAISAKWELSLFCTPWPLKANLTK